MAEGKYGLLDLRRYQALAVEGIKLKVFYDGEDVTDRCKWANDEDGCAYLYKVNDKGQKYIDPEDKTVAAFEIVRGDIEFRRVQMTPGEAKAVAKRARKMLRNMADASKKDLSKVKFHVVKNRLIEV